MDRPSLPTIVNLRARSWAGLWARFGLTRGHERAMFRDALREIVEKTEGAVAALIMDSSGIAVESYSIDGAALDINIVGIEFGVVLGSIKRAAESLEAGRAQEVAIGTDKMIALIRTLGDSYFLAVAIHPDGNLGKGRFLMRTAAPKLLAELE
jgi:predicted regulator of Ras-like GTPase activity (Roadblock/LC7/MglB family)